MRNNRIYEGDVFIRDGVIAKIAPAAAGAAGSGAKAGTVVDLDGQYLSPGFTDSHLHIESSMLSPTEFARHAVTHGTTSVFVDPHEIANVSGRDAVHMFMEVSEHVPMDIFVGIPSCVPATNMEDAGASIGLEDIVALVPDRRIYGLGEMMNFPGIVYGLGDARKRVDAVFDFGKVVDGHCPGLGGEDLRTYISNGKNDGIVRIMSDHELGSFDPGEAIEKMTAGMFVALRYGSASRDLDRILPELARRNVDLGRVMLCSDDLDPAELYDEGHMDRTLRRSIEIFRECSDLDPDQAAVRAISLATLNPARYFSRFFRHHDLAAPGEIAVGRRANLVAFGSLERIDVDKVIHGGKLVVDGGKQIGATPEYDYSRFSHSVDTGKTFEPEDFRISCIRDGNTVDVKVIEIIEGSLATKLKVMPFPIADGELCADVGRDIAKIAVIERHGGTGSYAVGFVRGLGLERGAIASTIAHDSHNLIVVGGTDENMARIVNFLSERGGGIAVMGDREISFLPLAIGGLMSTKTIEEVVRGHRELTNAAKETGSDVKSALMTMSFLALPVIPELKITNRGLVDVKKFEITALF